MVWLVITRFFTIHGVYQDEEAARRNARAAAGVLVQLPIAEDYRAKPGG